MNAVGIDVSKGKSMVAVMQPLGVVAASPFEVAHTESELKELAKFLKRLRARLRLSWNTQAAIMNQLPDSSTTRVSMFP